MNRPSPELALLTPGATVECHGPELLTLCAELDRLGLCAVALTRKKPAHYFVTVGERRRGEQIVHKARTLASPAPQPLTAP